MPCLTLSQYLASGSFLTRHSHELTWIHVNSWRVSVQTAVRGHRSKKLNNPVGSHEFTWIQWTTFRPGEFMWTQVKNLEWTHTSSHDFTKKTGKTCSLGTTLSVSMPCLSLSFSMPCLSQCISLCMPCLSLFKPRLSQCPASRYALPLSLFLYALPLSLSLNALPLSL